MSNFKDFIEMTLSFGQMLSQEMPDFSGAQHIGDIENNKIIFKNINGHDCYGITVDDKPRCFVYVGQKNIQGRDYLELRNIYTDEAFRGQNLAKKLLFFLKNVEQKSVVFGDVQSQLGQQLVKSVAKSNRFPLFWLNITTGEKHP